MPAVDRGDNLEIETPVVETPEIETPELEVKEPEVKEPESKEPEVKERDDQGRFIPKGRFDEAVGKERAARETAERKLAELQATLKQFHNPNSEKTCKLFSDFLGIDVAASWQWTNYDSARSRQELDALIKKRGEAVHRSKAPSAGVPAAHLVRKDELEKAIRFLKSLVEATEKATLA